MIIDLKPLFRGDTDSMPLDISFDFSDEKIGGVQPFVKPVKLCGNVVNRADVVSFDAVITAEYFAPCDRCGQDFGQICSVPLERTVVCEVHNDDNDEYIIAPDMKLDLHELTLSELILNLPMKHLCKDECKGICQKCGANLNDGDCDCDHREIDPRLSALYELLNQ